MGPLVNDEAVAAMASALAEAQQDGGEILCGGGRGPIRARPFVEPAIVRMPAQTAVVKRETFAPILYMLRVRRL